MLIVAVMMIDHIVLFYAASDVDAACPFWLHNDYTNTLGLGLAGLF